MALNIFHFVRWKHARVKHFNDGIYFLAPSSYLVIFLRTEQCFIVTIIIFAAVILPFSSTPINTVSNSNYQTESVNVIPSTTSVLRSSTSKTFSSLSKSTPHMKTPLFSTHPSASCKTIIITSVAPSSECDCSIYNPPVKTEQKISISSTLPSSSLKTSVSSTSASISSHNPTTHTKKQTTTPSTCKPPSSAGTTACLPNTCKNGGTCVIPGNHCKCEKIFAWHDCSVYVGK